LLFDILAQFFTSTVILMPGRRVMDVRAKCLPGSLIQCCQFVCYEPFANGAVGGCYFV
jgi:hypothetical protein